MSSWPALTHMATSSCKRSWEMQSLFLAVMCSATKFVSSIIKKERKMFTGEEVACYLGKSDDTMESIAECIRGPMFESQSALSLPWVSVSSPIKWGWWQLPQSLWRLKDTLYWKVLSEILKTSVDILGHAVEIHSWCWWCMCASNLWRPLYEKIRTCLQACTCPVLAAWTLWLLCG